MPDFTTRLTRLIDQARRMLSRVDLRQFPSIPIDCLDFAENLPDVCAVYFLFGNDKLEPLYIGRATCLKRRWRKGVFGGIRCTQLDHAMLKRAVALRVATLRWMEVPRAELGIIESLLIQVYKPEWNNHDKPKPEPKPELKPAGIGELSDDEQAEHFRKRAMELQPHLFTHDDEDDDPIDFKKMRDMAEADVKPIDFKKYKMW